MEAAQHAILEKLIRGLVGRWGMEAILAELAAHVGREKAKARVAKQPSKYLYDLENDLRDVLAMYKHRNSLDK